MGGWVERWAAGWISPEDQVFRLDTVSLLIAVDYAQWGPGAPGSSSTVCVGGGSLRSWAPHVVPKLWA